METYDPRREELFNKGKRIGKIAVIVAVVVFVVLPLVFGSYYHVEVQEQAVVTTFGVPRAVADPGLHFKIPLVQQVTLVNTTIRGFAIGYDATNNTATPEDSVMITNDYNFVNVDFFVEYKVSDPVSALYASQNPELILQNISRSCIRTVVSGYDVDTVLTTGKNEIQAAIKEMIVAKLDEHDIGLQLVNITIQDSEPPTVEVMEAFKSVENAKQGKETAINNANRYRNEKLPGATAQIDQIMQVAESTKTQRINEANAEVAKFNAMYAEYVKNPEVTKKRMYYEAMEDILPNLKVIIDGTGQTETLLPLDTFGGTSTGGAPSGTGSQSGAGNSAGSSSGSAVSQTEVTP
ncbi:MAG: FtsH protease activity modulator HflK [Lachnospiraceae bacterium]|nr:FtsH protease activity modulator HflK [Lachnospiraceae bacterium]